MSIRILCGRVFIKIKKDIPISLFLRKNRLKYIKKKLERVISYREKIQEFKSKLERKNKFFFIKKWNKRIKKSSSSFYLECKKIGLTEEQITKEYEILLKFAKEYTIKKIQKPVREVLPIVGDFELHLSRELEIYFEHYFSLYSNDVDMTRVEKEMIYNHVKKLFQIAIKKLR